MTPRIPPGGARETGLINAGIARVLGAATGGPPPNIFTTLGRHKRLFRPWLRFASRLMPFGALPRVDAELVILRVAHLCDSEYEAVQHRRMGVAAGLSKEDVRRIESDGPGAEGWSPRQAAILRAVDELHRSRDLPDEIWDELCQHLSEKERIELPMLVGHYEMLAMMLNTLRVEPDPVHETGFAKFIGRIAARRSA